MVQHPFIIGFLLRSLPLRILRGPFLDLSHQPFQGDTHHYVTSMDMDSGFWILDGFWNLHPQLKHGTAMHSPSISVPLKVDLSPGASTGTSFQDGSVQVLWAWQLQQRRWVHLCSWDWGASNPWGVAGLELGWNRVVVGREWFGDGGAY